MSPEVNFMRVVLDTSVVVSALVFSAGRVAELRLAWQHQHLIPLISAATAGELVRVLSYPKFRLASAEREDLLGDYLPFCETVEVPNPAPVTPSCRDPNDLPFLELALVGGADCLVTGDDDLLSLGARFRCPILTVRQLLERLP